MTTPRLPLLHAPTTQPPTARRDQAERDALTHPTTGPMAPRARRPDGRRRRKPLADRSNYPTERPRAAIGRARSDHSLRSSPRNDSSCRCSPGSDSNGSSSSELSASSMSSLDEPDEDVEVVRVVACGSAATQPTCGQRTAGSTDCAFFAMGCYWHAEAVYGGVDGVRSTEVGFIDGVEVVQVQYDTSVVSYAELLRAFCEGHEVGKRWANKKFESAIFASRSQWAEAKAGCGAANVRRLGSFTVGKESDQLYYLRRKFPRLLKPHKSKLRLSDAQLTQINHCLAFKLPYEHILESAQDDASGGSRSCSTTNITATSEERADSEKQGPDDRVSFPLVSTPTHSPIQPLLSCPLDGGSCKVPLGSPALATGFGSGDDLFT